jgi:hypothetical protein
MKAQDTDHTMRMDRKVLWMDQKAQRVPNARLSFFGSGTYGRTRKGRRLVVFLVDKWCQSPDGED